VCVCVCVCVCVYMKQSTRLYTPTDLNLQQHSIGDIFRNRVVYVRIDSAENVAFRKRRV